MAASVTWEVLRDLAAFRAERGCAISLYLDLDPGESPTAEAVDTRINALLDGVSRWESANQSELTREQKEGVRADLDRLRAFFEDEFSREGGVLVAFVGRERGDLYRLRAGRLEEIVEQHDDTPGRHDQGGWSQSRYQRHIEKLVLDHLKEVAEHVDGQIRRLRGPRLIVVASEETRSEFEA